ncbi:MAG TPA: hypothetical protein VK745_27125, partial [Polyangiaceae bacterium]|nr:hypothetical protein [Polyangiaceae bacterium]
VMRRWTGSWVVLTAAIAACSSSLDDSASTAARGPSNDGTGTGIGGSPSLGGPSSSGGSTSVIPPEQEEDQSFRAPVVSGRWVWTANPDTGKVAVVDAKNFTVRLADAGQAPTYLAALPTAQNTSKAIVINAKSQDATLLSAADTGDVTASLPIRLQADANTWAVSKSGNFAIAWTDSQGIAADPAEAFDDISVLDLRGAAPVATRLVVGFLPSRVFIDDDEQKAFVVATSGITMIDLSVTPPVVVGEKAVSRDIKDDATTRDVSVLPDGSYALVRHDGSATITLVNLDPDKLADATSATLSDVTLPGPVTDLDLTADSTSALAVVRGDPTPSVGSGDAGTPEAGTSDSEAGASSAGASSGGSTPLQSTLAILPIPQIFNDPTSFDTVSIDELFGLVNIAPQGTKALLYTNAVANSHITVLETALGSTYLSHRTVDAHGDVHDVFPSPDGAYAIASLTPQTSADKPGFAVIPVDATLPSHTQTTEAPVFAVAQSSSPSSRAVITVSDGASNFAAYIVRMPELVVDRVVLPSQPLAGATGLVPDAGMAYIAESNPEGRITFIDLETGVPRTITGFEISAKVINGN